MRRIYYVDHDYVFLKLRVCKILIAGCMHVNIILYQQQVTMCWGSVRDDFVEKKEMLAVIKLSKKFTENIQINIVVWETC